MHRAFFGGKFQEVEAAVMEADRSLFPADVFTEDAFLWAVAVVRSRVHAPLDGDQLALVPLADLVRRLGVQGRSWGEGGSYLELGCG